MRPDYQENIACAKDWPALLINGVRHEVSELSGEGQLSAIAGAVLTCLLGSAMALRA